MSEIMEIGPVPSDEPCEQLGPGYRPDVARAECRLHVQAIKQVCGEPPPGAKLVVTASQHDYGTYFEVAVRYDDGDQAATDYAFKVESDGPKEWPENLRQAAADLRLGGEANLAHRWRG